MLQQLLFCLLVGVTFASWDAYGPVKGPVIKKVVKPAPCVCKRDWDCKFFESCIKGFCVPAIGVKVIDRKAPWGRKPLAPVYYRPRIYRPYRPYRPRHMFVRPAYYQTHYHYKRPVVRVYPIGPKQVYVQPGRTYYRKAPFYGGNCYEGDYGYDDLDIYTKKTWIGKRHGGKLLVRKPRSVKYGPGKKGGFFGEPVFQPGAYYMPYYKPKPIVKPIVKPVIKKLPCDCDPYYPGYYYGALPRVIVPPKKVVKKVVATRAPWYEAEMFGRRGFFGGGFYGRRPIRRREYVKTLITAPYYPGPLNDDYEKPCYDDKPKFRKPRSVKEAKKTKAIPVVGAKPCIKIPQSIKEALRRDIKEFVKIYPIKTEYLVAEKKTVKVEKKVEPAKTVKAKKITYTPYMEATKLGWKPFYGDPPLKTEAGASVVASAPSAKKLDEVPVSPGRVLLPRTNYVSSAHYVWKPCDEAPKKVEEEKKAPPATTKAPTTKAPAPATCTCDADCKSTQVCQAGKCTPRPEGKECFDHTECDVAKGEECRSHVCVLAPIGCSSVNDCCPRGRVCSGNVCTMLMNLDLCWFDGCAGADQFCHKSSGRCVKKSAKDT